MRPFGSARSPASRSKLKLNVRKPSGALPARMAARAASSGVNPLGSAETFATISGGAASRFRPAVALAFQKFQGLSTTSVHHRQILFRVIFTLSPNAVVSRRQFDRLMLLMDHPCRRAKNTQEQLLTGLIQLSSGVCLDAMCVASNLTLSENQARTRFCTWGHTFDRCDQNVSMSVDLHSQQVLRVLLK